MHCLEIHTILIFLVLYFAKNTKGLRTPEFSRDTRLESTNVQFFRGATTSADSTCRGPKCYRYWMATMGYIDQDLMNIQAIIIKDEDVKGACNTADRHSTRRYLMCVGSILNRNHVLTSASCIHTATHIKHNIRGMLAVAIAPLKPSMQVIKVIQYKINPAHNTNPYADNHVTHNLAILKLACRIDMENFHKVELPQAPFVQLCNDEICNVAIYRKHGRNHWVVRQILAPNVPLPNRRRKETTARDEKARKIDDEMRNDRNRRFKRKLAEPPIFTNLHASRNKSGISDEVLSNSTILSTEQTTRIVDLNRTTNDGYEDWVRRPVGKEKIRSFVVRSSDGFQTCAQTGAPVMFNKTQTAVASVPCDDRQPWTKWGYTDLYTNIIWIKNVLQDWNTNTSEPSEILDPIRPGLGNFSSCSTCIFNFFIEIGCKDKAQCGNKTTTVVHEKLHDSHHSSTSVGSMPAKICSDSGSVDIEIGTGQACDNKPIEKFNQRPELRGNWAKPLKPPISGLDKTIQRPDLTKHDIFKHEQSIGVDSAKKIVLKDQQADKNKYSSKGRPRIPQNLGRINERNDDPSIIRTYKIPKRDSNKNGENNEIGLDNIDSADWLAEVEKGLEVNSEIKR